MVAPELAVVRPRVVSPLSGETLLLEDVVADELAAGCRIIQITGEAGTGKTTALAHVAARLADRRGLVFLDDPTAGDIAIQAASLRVICTGRFSLREILGTVSSLVGAPHPPTGQVVLPLAPWTDDESIEYLRGIAPDRCGSALSRLKQSPLAGELRGNAALSRAVLDEFLADEQLTSLRVAVQRIVYRTVSSPLERHVAGQFCLSILQRETDEAARSLDKLASSTADYVRLRLLRHSLVQRLLAAERVAQSILSPYEKPLLRRALPTAVIEELAWLMNADSLLRKSLEEMLSGDDRNLHPPAATLLFAGDRTWRPSEGCRASLAGGQFVEASWQGLKLRLVDDGPSTLAGANLSRANLRESLLERTILCATQLGGASLSKAVLTGADADGANLAGATLIGVTADRIKLRRANLQRAVLDGASLIAASLEGADLTAASLQFVNLTRAWLTGCKIEGADFTGACLREASLSGLVLREATLTEARFAGAQLVGCDLEGVRLDDADFFQADLSGAWLTGSVLPRADFRHADLRNAGLADIHWEHADLRGADLRGCTFHMGSTRSGLVGSPYPGHGSKTGFYTDDYHDQAFKHPEEIRKANLCGADLRGANLSGVDFYLVDLRDAFLDDGIPAYIEQSGGILYDRCW